METSETYRRKRILYLVITTMFMFFMLRLAQLQVLYQDVYGKKSEENSIRTVTREPIRGYIFDRLGKLVVDNRPSYTVTITPAEFDIRTIDYLGNILGIDQNYIADRLKKGKAYNRFTPARIKRDIDFRTLSIIEENRDQLPGVDYQIESKRYYPAGAKAPHLFGYTKEISERQLADLSQDYRSGDMIGASGIEAAYESYLRGTKGYEFITVNAKGQLLGPFNDGKNNMTAQEGNDLTLTLDADLQAFAESLLTDKHGAIVALDPTDGGILAMVSKPDFDPMLLSGETPPEVWAGLIGDPNKPLFNRATLTRYPPGSTFKMVLAAAALEENIITTGWRVECNGAFRLGNKVFTDLHVHGSTTIVEAIQKSCNVFFYTLMLKTGLERWNHYGKEFGFGSPTRMDIYEENPGLLPSEEYYDRVYGKGRWTQGYLVNLGIGQGELGVSPIQMACYVSALANRGHYYQPHVVAEVRHKRPGIKERMSYSVRTIELKNSVWDILQEGMFRVVNTPGGTGGAARVPEIAVAGKTGTAENPHGEGHAWFIGYAPYENPKIAICVMVENAGFGGAVSAPIAGLCIEKYLYREIVRTKRPAPVVTTPTVTDD